MASFYASLGRKYREEGSQVIDGEDPNDYVPEGVEAMVPYKGSVTDLIKQFVGWNKVRTKLLWRKKYRRNAT